MTTTYSPNLRLSIIGDGEQTGAWGNTTNTNTGRMESPWTWFGFQCGIHRSRGLKTSNGHCHSVQD